MVADADNPLVLNVLHASSTAYSFNPDERVNEVREQGGPGDKTKSIPTIYTDHSGYLII